MPSLVSSGGVRPRVQLALSGRSLAARPRWPSLRWRRARRPSTSRMAACRSTATSRSRSAASRTTSRVQQHGPRAVVQRARRRARVRLRTRRLGPFDVLSGFARIEAATTASGRAPAACSRRRTPWEIASRICRATRRPVAAAATTGSLRRQSALQAIPARPKNTELGRYTQLRYEPRRSPDGHPEPRAWSTRTRAARTTPTRSTGSSVSSRSRARTASSRRTATSRPSKIPSQASTRRSTTPAYFYFSASELQVRRARRPARERHRQSGDRPRSIRVATSRHRAPAFRPNPFNSADLNPLIVNPQPGSCAAAAASCRRVLRRSSVTDRPQRGVIAGRVLLRAPSSASSCSSTRTTTSTRTSAEAELAWNRGASQQDENELKELYADMEFFDSSSGCARASRTSCGARRSCSAPPTSSTRPIWRSRRFRSRGVAHPALVDPRRLFVLRRRPARGRAPRARREPRRLRAQPTPVAAASRSRCSRRATRRTALFFHGVTGFGARRRASTAESVGQTRPGSSTARAWSSASGSSASRSPTSSATTISPYADRLFDYSRNVDPATGRPRKAGARGPCTTGQESACLGTSPAVGDHARRHRR